MNSNGFDLNLLRELDVLLRVRPVSRAAEQLDVSPPTLSRNLAKLRDAFGDELLVRTGSGYALTARAEVLVEPVRALLADADVLFRPAKFAPGELDVELTVASFDLEMRLFFPTLLKRLAVLAPRVRLRAAPLARADFGVLDSGEPDVVIVSRETERGRYRRRLLFSNSPVCVVSSRLAHRFGREITLEQFTRTDHGLVTVEGTGDGFVDVALRDLGLQRNIVVRAPSFLLVPSLCAERDLIFTVPRRVLQLLPGRSALATFAPPISLPPTSSYLYWHARNHANPMQRWFRDLIFETNTTLSEDT